MKKATTSLAMFLLAVLVLPNEAAARWPSDSKVYKDVKKHWSQTWPEQQVEYVKKKNECEKTILEDKTRPDKVRKLKACLIKVDVYVARGYRYFIYRDTFAYYVRKKLRSVQLGELSKAWKEGGVPAPTEEESTRLLGEIARQKLGVDQAQVVIQETGRPRPYGEFYRVTLVVDLSYSKQGQQEKKEKVFATLQSDGTDWKPIADLAF